MKPKRILIAILLLVASSALGIQMTQASGLSAPSNAPRVQVGTAFTYQGRLNRGGGPATGYYDFRFILYNQLGGGAQVGSPIARENVEVRNGLFTVLLDFGAVFDGTLLFLEVSVKDHSIIGYTTLLPRHALWPKPYAIYSANAGTAANFSGALAGDVTGTQSNTTVARLQGRNVASTAPASGQVLKWSGSQWAPQPDDGGVGSFWSLTGNTATTPGTNFIGTADNQPLEFKVSNTRALRLEYATNGLVNVIGGYSGNSVTSGAGAVTISGGGDLNNTNRVTDYAGAVGGGTNNQAGDNTPSTTSASYATVGGGNSNTASDSYATVGGGNSNTAGSIQATVGGGANNTVNVSASNATIGGGASNTADGSGATIGGGGANSASNTYATVGGGDHSAASGTSATVGGGSYNTASNAFATVGGGDHNSASGDAATVAGGKSNTASDYTATVGGGQRNSATGQYTTVPGGLDAHAGHVGEMAYASGKFTSQGDAQTSTYVLRNITTGGTQTELFLDGSTYRIGIGGIDRTLTFDILVVARRDSSNQSAGYQLRGVIKNDNGTVALVGSVLKDNIGENDANWDVTVVADDDTDYLRILVTGAAGATIRWVATVRTVEVKW